MRRHTLLYLYLSVSIVRDRYFAPICLIPLPIKDTGAKGNASPPLAGRTLIRNSVLWVPSSAGAKMTLMTQLVPGAILRSQSWLAVK
jgi:hypothetical protein